MVVVRVRKRSCSGSVATKTFFNFWLKYLVVCGSHLAVTVLYTSRNKSWLVNMQCERNMEAVVKIFI